MPKVNERKRLLQAIDSIVYRLALVKSTLGDVIHKASLEEEIDSLLLLKFGILSTRYLYPICRIPKSTSFRELVMRLPAQDFKQVLRMNKETFNYVLSLIQNHTVFQNNSNRKQACVELQLTVTLERLGTNGNGASVGRIARGQGIGNGTVTLYSSRVIKALNSLTDQFIKWPGAIERRKIATRIHEKHGIPGCVGVVDGTHILLSQRPGLDGETYFTRKHRYAINVQIVCDDQKRIRMFQTGWPGSVFDWTCFSQSNLAKNPFEFFSQWEYLLGDTAYVLSNWMLIPYKGAEFVLPGNEAFNTIISGARVVIEHVNGILKGRWASLSGIRTQINSKNDCKKVNDWIRSIFTLHNIMIARRDGWDEYEIEEDNMSFRVDNLNDESGRQLRNRVKEAVLGLT